MGLITRCPACGTMFKVVPDQLRISEGWVRCGHCTEVFDASAHLQEAADDAAAQATPAIASGTDHPVLQEEAEEDGPASSSLESELGDRLPPEEPDSTLMAAEAKALVEDPLDQPFELRREDLSAPGELGAREPAPVPAAPPPLQELAFVRQAREQARWERPAVRALLIAAVTVLALLLTAQVAVHDRNRLAAAEPGLRPWLAVLCAAVDCTIQAPRQIDAIAIDSSSFNKLRPDTYRLQVTLRNQGTTEVAMPALELTLTDSQEQPVVRRVLLPAELGANRAALAATSEWSGSVALAVLDESLGSRIAGYRLLAFYP